MHDVDPWAAGHRVYCLSVDTVSKRYERNRWALRELSLRLEAGVLGLVGPNGAGKTTLLKMLATLLQPTEGSITWNGPVILRFIKQSITIEILP